MKCFSNLAVAIIAGMLISSCNLVRLRQDLRTLENASTISGRVVDSSGGDKPIFVGLFEPAQPTPVLVTYTIMYRPGPFRFIRPEGDYLLAAFEDANEDLAYQRTERIGWYGDPTVVRAREGLSIEGLELRLRYSEEARQVLPHLFRSNLPYSVEMTVPNFHFGELVSINDPRFTQEHASQGLWEPVSFFQEQGVGIYFLEPYDPDKMPLLFIHGANSHPGAWRELVARIDRERFQPWLFSYPTGLRLAMTRDGLERGIKELYLRYRFDSMNVVAHSMGGLLARSFILRRHEEGNLPRVDRFVTISTPWQGSEAAWPGIEHSPSIVPSWYDMVPGSPFIREIFERPWPKNTEYALFFGHRGGSGFMTGGNDDGAISLKSLLKIQAQDDAAIVRGFDEDHVSILSSEIVAEKLSRFLSGVER